MKKEHRFDDLGFVVLSEHEAGWVHVQFEVFEEIELSADSGNPFDEAEMAVEGSVTFDGCSNWDFGGLVFHACERKDLVNLGEVLARCRDLAKTLIPRWCGK